MSDKFITYRSGYKYQLAQKYIIKTDIIPIKEFSHEFLSITSDGVLTVERGYAWDGPSGPLVDTSKNMRGSLVHDALYQLIRHEVLKQDDQDKADRLFQEICNQDGVHSVFSKIYYLGLKFFGKRNTKRKAIREKRNAPKMKVL